MYSYSHFRPGGRTNTAKIINYIAEYNAINLDSNKLNCYCVINKYDKNTPVSDSPTQKFTYANRIANLIKSSKGGKTQYGNFYLGEPLNVNYLGRIQGMPGGSGSPPVNRF